MDDRPTTSRAGRPVTNKIGMSDIHDADEITQLAPEPECSTTQPSMNQNVQLTVDKKWIVEEKLPEMMSLMDTPSRIVPVAKWIFTILLGSAITALFAATKISFIYLSLALNMTAPATTSGSHDIKHTSQFLIIFLVIEIPYILLFLRAAWEGLFSEQNPWPQKSAVVCCILLGVMEPSGIIILALKVLPQLSVSLGVLVMSTTIALPIFVETGKTLVNSKKPAVKIAMVVSCLFILAGLGLTSYMIHNRAKDSIYTRDILHAVAGVVCLNLAWLPRLLRHVNQPAIDVKATNNDNKNTPASQSVEETASMVTANTDQSSANNATNTKQQSKKKDFISPAEKEASWKASFILNGVKIVATFISSFIVFYVDSSFVQDIFSKESHETFISAWDFASSKIDEDTWTAFGVNLIGALVCYTMAFIACHTNVQRGCLAIPFMVSLPLTILLVAETRICVILIGNVAICQSDPIPWYLIFCATVSMTIGQTLSFGRYAFRKEKIFLRREEKYFWIPGFFGAIADVWLLLDTRQTIKEGRMSTKAYLKYRKTKVYICTTMYREDESEMKQLLESLAKINVAQVQSDTLFEAHIILDGGVKQKTVTEFSLILISLLEDTLEVKPSECTKVITPYGMKLSWGLKAYGDKHKMAFSIHLKDNTLVKNKKRWSQVMYMSYVLDFQSKAETCDEENYILTTDADVMFTPDSVEALLDLMCRDQTVGAVCARTHPMGSGPLVWYQTFEYAIGHWFQKASEHVLGSVLCAPGCFSVYRCKALAEILPKYCKKVESSFDFLTKDMGEDRWLCTLMVQTGWRIEYCAASDNSTNCPSEFEEFYKQRRRWIASTLANLMLIIKEWKYIALFNDRVSVVFLVYQVLLLFSTLIAPSTVILVVAGGLVFSWNIDALTAVVLQLIVCVLFAIACIKTSSKTQMLLAKIYTFLYAVIMCAVAVGTAEQVVSDLSLHTQSHNISLINDHAQNSQHVSLSIPVSVTTIYFAFLISVFLLAGLLHPKEITCLFHGICFLLCIPSAYLVLMIYSICNLTDSTWGTREGEKTSNAVKKIPWAERFKKTFFFIFFCLVPKPKPGKGVDAETQTVGPHSGHLMSTTYLAEPEQNSFDPHDSGTLWQGVEDLYVSGDYQRQIPQDDETEDVPIPVDEWLPPDFKSKYADIFKKHGFDNTLFLKGLTETDLNRMGINKGGHVQFLMAEISILPAFEIEYKVPTNVNEWLQEIGLIQYKDNFRRNRIRSPKEMEILKKFDRKEFENELGITKEGHIKRLINAIRMLRDPSESQQKSIRMRQMIDEAPVYILKELDVAEYEFWSKLRAKCLEPDLKAFGIDSEVKVKLVELRNNWLLVMAVANTLWLILITTLATKGDLTLLGANPIGLVFLFIFGFLFVVQFFAMLIHRISTLSHYVARAPYTFGQPFRTSWSFKDKVYYGHERLSQSVSTQVKAVPDIALKKSPRHPANKNANINENVESSFNECTPLLINEIIN